MSTTDKELLLLSEYIGSVINYIDSLRENYTDIPEDVENRIIWATNDLHNIKSLIDSKYLNKYERKNKD